MRFLGICCIVLCVTACKVGPNFSPPCVMIEDAFMECGDPHIDCGDPFCSQWWSYFNYTLINYLIVRALSGNLTLKTAGMRILQARAELGIAIGEFFPQMQKGIAKALRTQISTCAPNTVPEMGFDYWNFVIGLQATWEL